MKDYELTSEILTKLEHELHEKKEDFSQEYGHAADSPAVLNDPAALTRRRRIEEEGLNMDKLAKRLSELEKREAEKNAPEGR